MKFRFTNSILFVIMAVSQYVSYVSGLEIYNIVVTFCNPHIDSFW